MKKLLFIIFVLFFALTVNAQDISTLFENGNKFYEQGNYEDAVKSYESILSQGFYDSVLFYNLGNAYLKDKQLGKAILSYERGLLLSPHDEDLRFNLRFAQSFIKHEESRKAPFEKLLFSLDSLLSINELTIFVSVAYTVLMILLGVYLFRKKRYIYWVNISLAILIAACSLWLYGKIYRQIISRSAIVIVNRAEVRNGPATDYSVGFTVPEGEKVIILGTKGDWYAVGLKQKGLKGWVEKSNIEEIVFF